jgi:hypothetical protein
MANLDVCLAFLPNTAEPDRQIGRFIMVANSLRDIAEPGSCLEEPEPKFIIFEPAKRWIKSTYPEE